jgi:T5SS/PEP-CTERM-associated repeat protein
LDLATNGSDNINASVNNGSVTVTHGIYVGALGTATATISNGSNISSDYINIGDQSGSVGTLIVQGPGTTVTTANGVQFQNVEVGNSGKGTLTVSNQATVATTNMEVAVTSQSGITDNLGVHEASLTAKQYLVGCRRGVGRN